MRVLDGLCCKIPHAISKPMLPNVNPVKTTVSTQLSDSVPGRISPFINAFLAEFAKRFPGGICWWTRGERCRDFDEYGEQQPLTRQTAVRRR
mmetsp:Transcript_13201/g.28673  ORF Transcript_13201/g.28673 Transcript_13201/m.28673 type:complete len:92 (-) Transcript_13201:152-427(-)